MNSKIITNDEVVELENEIIQALLACGYASAAEIVESKFGRFYVSKKQDGLHTTGHSLPRIVFFSDDN